MESPKEKMPFHRAVAMVFFAFIVDFLKFFFSILALTGPMLVGVLAGVEASNYVGTTIGTSIGSMVAGSSFLLEWVTGGLGALGLEIIGNFFAMIIGFLGWAVLMLWMTLVHIPVFGAKISLKRISVVFGMGILDLIPLVNAGTWLTVGILYLVRAERKDYREQLLKYEQWLNNAKGVQMERRRDANTSQSPQNT